MSFRANSFARFAKRHGISMTVVPVDPYDLVDPDSLKEARHFGVTLQRGDRTNSFAIVFPEYRTELPPIEDVLEYMANEIAVYEHFGLDAKAFARFANVPLDEALRHVSEAASAAAPIRIFLGPVAYEEILSISEDRG